MAGIEDSYLLFTVDSIYTIPKSNGTTPQVSQPKMNTDNG